MPDEGDRYDNQLLDAGDIGRLVAKYDPAVKARCIAALRGNVDAEDVAQNVLIRVLSEFQRGRRWNDLPFRVVIHQITTWTIKDYFEGRDYTARLPDDWDPSTVDGAHEIVSRDYVMELFSHLTEAEQPIAKLYVFGGMRGAEIAARLGYDDRNPVDQAIFRLKNKLRDLVSDPNG